MARRTTKKKGPTPEEEAKEFFTALDMIEQEKGISKAYMMEKITQALVSAYKRDHEGAEENIVVLTDPEKNSVRIIVRRDVVEEVTNPDTEISLEEARRFLPAVQLGDVVSSELKPKNFGRIAAQTARQVIIQGIREAERNMVYEEFVGKTQELITGMVTRTDPRSGALHVKIGSGRESTEALLTAKEQVPGESYREGDRIKVYVVEVRRGTRGTQVLISRTHYGPPPVRDGSAGTLRRRGGDPLHCPGGRQPHQDGGLVQRRGSGPHRRLRRRPGRPGQHHRG